MFRGKSSSDHMSGTSSSSDVLSSVACCRCCGLGGVCRSRGGVGSFLLINRIIRCEEFLQEVWSVRWGVSTIAEVASPVFDPFLVVESLENVVYVEGDCPIEVCVLISECVSKEDVLFENFFRDKQSIANNLRAHKKLVFRTISVNGFEDESYRVV